jgi:hypothetical protein
MLLPSLLTSPHITQEILSIKLAVNSVRKQAVDIRSELRGTNMIIMQQFGSFNQNVKRMATGRGVISQRVVTA